MLVCRGVIMPRFILRYRGSGPAHPEDVGKIRALPDTTVLDSSSNRMMLVDAPEQHLRAAVRDMPDWVLIPEQTVPLPDTRKKVLHEEGES
jgi:hypothetical protein